MISLSPGDIPQAPLPRADSGGAVGSEEAQVPLRACLRQSGEPGAGTHLLGFQLEQKPP